MPLHNETSTRKIEATIIKRVMQMDVINLCVKSLRVFLKYLHHLNKWLKSQKHTANSKGLVLA